MTKGASADAAARSSAALSVTSSRAPPICAFSSAAVPSAITRPWSTTTMRSASSSASSRYCVVSSSVAPSPTSSRIIAPHAHPAGGVETGRRLVEEEHGRPRDEAGREVEPAAHAARVLLEHAVARVGRARTGEQLRPPGRASRRRRPLSRPTMTRFWRPVSTSSRVASWAVTPIWRCTARGSGTTSWPATRAEPRVGQRRASSGCAPRSSCRRRWGRGRRGSRRSAPRGRARRARPSAPYRFSQAVGLDHRYLGGIAISLPVGK